jgi:hypothetical protein
MKLAIKGHFECKRNSMCYLAVVMAEPHMRYQPALGTPYVVPTYTDP